MSASQVWAVAGSGDKSEGRKKRKAGKTRFLEEQGLTQGGFPRHAPAYKLIKLSGLFPGFDWHVSVGLGGPVVIFANYPRSGGRPWPLVKLVERALAALAKKEQR